MWSGPCGCVRTGSVCAKGGVFLDTEAKVLQVNGPSVTVEVLRQSACTGECKDCSGCSVKSMQITAFCDLPVQPGDRVLVSSQKEAVLFGMFIVFILPLILPVAAYLLAAKSGFGILFAAIAVIVALLLIWILSKSKWYLKKSQPRVVRVIKERGKI